MKPTKSVPNIYILPIQGSLQCNQCHYKRGALYNHCIHSTDVGRGQEVHAEGGAAAGRVQRRAAEAVRRVQRPPRGQPRRSDGRSKRARVSE